MWNGACSATVEIDRLAGPHDAVLTERDSRRFGLPPEGTHRLTDPEVRRAVYQLCLTVGTQFDIYRWVNLADLAAVWPTLQLPRGVHDEWESVLAAEGLLGPPPRPTD